MLNTNVTLMPSVEPIHVPVYLGHSEYEVPDVQEKLTNESMPDPADREVSGRWINTGGHITKIGTFAAKGCYHSFGPDGRSCEANQRTILEHKHGSVLEHINIGFFVEGITRALSIELNRHRHFAISQRSTRYTDEEEASMVLEPYYAGLYEDYRGRGDLLSAEEWSALGEHVRSFRDSLDSYEYQVGKLMDLNPLNLDGRELRKWARGKARNSLPHNLETRGTWTTNLRSWRWILEARSDRHAADEIRRLSYILYRYLSDLAPMYFEDFEEVHFEGDLGYPELRPEHSKV